MDRNILHIQVDEGLELNVEDMQNVVKLFHDAALDPVGATVITVGGVDCELRVEDTQEGEGLTLVTASMVAHEPMLAHDIQEIWRVGRIEGHRVFCYDTEEIWADVDEDYINKFALNNDGYYVLYGDGSEGFLISGVAK